MQNNNNITILKFFGAWCSPCKAISPIVDAVAKELNLNVIPMDVDKEEEITSKYNIRSVPTLVFLKGDKEVNRHVSIITKEKLIELVKSL